MHLNRDQAMAVRAVREAGYNPVQAIVLTGRHRELNCGVVSVSAIKGTDRFNIRVAVDARKGEQRVLSVEKLHTLINNNKSQDVTTIDGCVVKTVKRRYVNVN